jgi:putative RNA 2'-phosphotransferase
MSDIALKRLTKAVFAMLGRRPDAFGIVLDRGGWISIKELHQVLITEPDLPHISSKALHQFFSLYRPERFEWQEDRVRVRPEWQSPDLTAYEETIPPERLYVTIRPKAHAYVIDHGLRPGGDKRWIVLSADREMALKIGRRRDRNPILVEVLASKACKTGIVFRRAGESLYLVDRLGPQWMNIPPLAPKQERHPKESRSDKTKLDVEKVPTPEEIGGFVPRKMPSYYKKDLNKREKRYKKGHDRDPKWKKYRRTKGLIDRS